MPRQVQYYPLTTSQQMIFLDLKYSYLRSVVNICAMMHFENDIDEKLMMQAIYLAVLRNHAFSLRLHSVAEINEAGKRQKIIKQYFSDQAPEKISVDDFSDSTDDEMNNAIAEWSESEFPNKAMDTQLYRIHLVRKPDKHYAVYICISHVITDAYSLMAIARDLVNVYVSLRERKAVPKPLLSPLPAYQADWDYQKSERKIKDLEFWDKEVFVTEPHYTNINGLSDKKNYHEGKRYGVGLRLWEIHADLVNYILPKELADRVRLYASAERISPQVLYLLAVRNFLSKENDYQEDVLFFNTIARRATISQKKAGGTMVQAVPFRSQLSNNTSFAKACLLMQELQTMYYHHSMLPITEIIDLFRRKFNLPNALAVASYHTVSVTFQPFFVAAEPTVPVHFTRHSNGVATMPLYINIIAADKSGDLLCNYEYITKFTTKERINKFHHYMLDMLDSALNNPQLTLKELMKKDLGGGLA